LLKHHGRSTQTDYETLLPMRQASRFRVVLLNTAHHPSMTHIECGNYMLVKGMKRRTVRSMADLRPPGGSAIGRRWTAAGALRGVREQSIAWLVSRHALARATDLALIEADEHYGGAWPVFPSAHPAMEIVSGIPN
jgi:hypothetical protein